MEGTHTGFLRQIMGKQAWRLGDGMWDITEAEVVQEAAGIQSETTYIERRQATVAQRVALRPLFEVCAREKG